MSEKSLPLGKTWCLQTLWYAWYYFAILQLSS